MRLDERAWIGFVSTTIVLNKTDPFKVETNVYILGKSPAVNIVTRAGARPFPVEHMLQLNDLTLDPTPISNGTSVPGAAFPIRKTAPASDPQEQLAVDSILQKKSFLYFYGETTHRDIFRNDHWVHFCYVFSSGDSKEAHPCNIYNDSDADHETK
jgi:hypothetical protein